MPEPTPPARIRCGCAEARYHFTGEVFFEEDIHAAFAWTLAQKLASEREARAGTAVRQRPSVLFVRRVDVLLARMLAGGMLIVLTHERIISVFTVGSRDRILRSFCRLL